MKNKIIIALGLLVVGLNGCTIQKEPEVQYYPHTVFNLPPNAPYGSVVKFSDPANNVDCYVAELGYTSGSRTISCVRKKNQEQ